MKGSFKKGDVVEDFQVAGNFGITLQATAMLDQEYEREVGPVGLLLDPGPERADVGADQGLGGDQGEPRSRPDLVDELLDGGALDASHAGIGQNGSGDLRIAPEGREDQRALGKLRDQCRSSIKSGDSANRLRTPRAAP